MLNIVKKTLLIVCQLGNTIYWYARQAYHFDFKNQIEYLPKERSLAILANGPSLETLFEQLSQIKDNDVCCLNFFALDKIFDKIKPSMYVLADPGFWIEHDEFKKEREVLYKILKEDVAWKMVIYVPYMATKVLDFNTIFAQNKNISIRSYHSAEWNGFESMRNYVYQKGISMPRPQNVTVACIFVAINSGYKTINLYGVDHSWTQQLAVNEQNQVCLRDVHFYDTEQQNMKVWYKIDHPYKMHEILRDLAYMFESYHQLRLYADYRSVKIFNCTNESFIDAFERK